MKLRALLICLLPVLPLGAVPVFAQQQAERRLVQSPILTIDSDRVFTESAFGLRVADDVEPQSAEISAENRLIEADLKAEERKLTDQRSKLSPDAFSGLADAFDEKVQKTRASQAAKGRALNELVEKERHVFLAAAGPVLEQMMIGFCQRQRHRHHRRGHRTAGCVGRQRQELIPPLAHGGQNW